MGWHNIIRWFSDDPSMMVLSWACAWAWYYSIIFRLCFCDDAILGMDMGLGVGLDMGMGRRFLHDFDMIILWFFISNSILGMGVGMIFFYDYSTILLLLFWDDSSMVLLLWFYPGHGDGHATLPLLFYSASIWGMIMGRIFFYYYYLILQLWSYLGHGHGHEIIRCFLDSSSIILLFWFMLGMGMGMGVCMQFFYAPSLILRLFLYYY